MGKTLAIDGHDTILLASPAKRIVLMRATGLQIPEGLFVCADIYRLGMSFWDPAARKMAYISEKTYKGAMSELFLPDVYIEEVQPCSDARDVITFLRGYFERIDLVCRARGLQQGCVEELVLKHDLDVDNVVLTYGADKVSSLNQYDAVIDNDPHCLHKLAMMNDNIRLALVLPDHERLGQPSTLAPANLHHSIGVSRTLRPAAEYVTHERRTHTAEAA